MTGWTAGSAVMSWGAGVDVFDFNAVADTGNTAATRDRITDFAHLTDDIDLSTIDANGAAVGHTFLFLATMGAAFTGVKGHVWTAPAVQEESDVSAKRSGAAMYPAYFRPGVLPPVRCSRCGRWP